MKTILIEAVSNGWIVRPFQPSTDWVCTDRPAIAVFTNIRDLQTALPVLLDIVPIGIPITDPHPHAVCGYVAPVAVWPPQT